MIYRQLGRTGVKVGVVGLGAEHLEKQPYALVEEVVSAAIDGGMNYMDIFMSNPQVRSDIGRALKGRRDKMMLQGHLGSLWENEQCFPGRDTAKSIAAFNDLLSRLGVDYIDTLSLFFVDNPEDVDNVLAAEGAMELAYRLKKEGKARFIGMSGHIADTAARMVESGQLDVLMFPVNPAFDLLSGIDNIDDLFKPETYAKQAGGKLAQDRARLYRACEKQGTAMVSMKTYAAGWALKPDNMLGVAFTPVQLIHYALSRPAVVSALIGCRSAQEVAAALAYVTATEEQRDFSHLCGAARWDLQGACMYCNHCLPCPVHIDVAAVTRALDLSQEAPEAAKAQYASLDVKASECIQCGACVAKCPFKVDVIGNMARAAGVLGA